MGHADSKAPAQPQAHPQPTAATFVRVGIVLLIITATEFSIVYLKGVRGVVVTVLAVLSVLKFALVGGYFMHLKFDHKLLGWVFAIGAALATLITVAQQFVNLV